MQKILPLLSRLIPVDLAKRALEKKIPSMNNYFAGMAASGYGLDTALDFLRDQFEPIEGQNLRADEKSAAKQVQQSQLVPNLAKGLGKAALGGATAGVAASAIPTVIGNLFQEKEKAPKEKSELSRESLQKQFEEGYQEKSLAEMAPDIYDEISFDVSNGLSLDEAIANIKGQPEKYAKQISNLERNLKMPFAELVKQSFNTQGSQPQNQSQGKSALLETMQQITQTLQRMRGNG